VIVPPPFEAGGVNDTVACALPGVAVPIVGAPGSSAAIVSVIVLLKKVACVAVLESVPVTVKVQVQAAVGVPVIAPVLESASPAGSAPLATVVEKVYGAAPPEAVSVWLYAAPTVPLASVVGVTEITGAETVIETVAGEVVPDEFVAV
jgi:hypothetical protein